MKFFPAVIIFLGINVYTAYGLFVGTSGGIFNGLSLENMLNAPPGLFSGSNSTSDGPLGGLTGGLTGITGLFQQLQSLTQNQNAFKSLFANFRKAFKKDTPATEENLRMGIFKTKLYDVLDHNIKSMTGQVSYEKGLNFFSDMTPEEVLAKFTGFKRGSENETATATRWGKREAPVPAPIMEGRQTRAAPDSRDWRDYGYVSPPKHQGDCGSCTLFASTGMMESSWVTYRRGSLMDLSEQELLDCIPASSGHLGCGGNSYETTLDYLKSHGQTLDSNYPYTKKVGTCQNKPVATKITGYWAVDKNEEALKQALGTYGPVGIAINMNGALSSYRSGIFDGNCDGAINHAVLAVGYGTENGKDFWVIKNSWGTNWGDGGYFKIRRNYNNLCQVANYAFFVTSNA